MKTDMISLGKMNKLRVLRKSTSGIVLDGKELGKVFLEENQLTSPVKKGDEIEVFIYTKSKDHLIATILKPKAMVGEFTLLQVISKSSGGAFLDWGLEKDLFVPNNEQKTRMLVESSYLVHIYIDPHSNKFAASSKLDKFLDKVPASYTEEQEVDLLISDRTDLGYKAIINNAHSGVLYRNEVFKKIKYGQKIKGYIKNVRLDNKIDLSLEKPGFQKIDSTCNDILTYLKSNMGHASITDKSQPELISQTFGISKKSFKKAIGALYKRKQITIESDGIRLVNTK